MPKTCKIEQKNLGETVARLMADGQASTRAELTEVLNAQYDADVSEATVGRYMARLRSAAGNEAFTKITEHVNRTVPDDLEALEEMERQALAWSREAGASQAERAADAAERIAGELDAWRDMLLKEKDNYADTIRWIVKRCTAYIAADDRRQEQRLAAMRMVHKIIETKLSKAGLLDDETKGRIVFLQRQAAGDDDSAPEKEKGRVLSMVNTREGDSG